MKKNSLIIILIIIIFLLLSYIVYDKVINTKEEVSKKDEEIVLADSLSLPYVNVYLTSDGLAYLQPINYEKIDNIKGGKNLKERLTTLYDRAFYFDIYLDNNKLKGFKVELDSDITKIRKIEVDDIIYVVFIKENNKIGLFNYDEYYNLLYTDVVDNYKDIKNIKDIDNNKFIYLDGSSNKIKL